MSQYYNSWMDTESEVVPTKIEKVIHFNQQITLPQGATIVPYQPLHTSNSKKSKKSKNKFEEFTYYRFSENKDKLVKVLFKDEEKYMVCSYFPFIDPKDDIEKVADMPAKKLEKVIKTEAAYIGHFDDQIVVKKMLEVKLGQDGNQFDTVGDNFEVIKVSNKQRFDQFLRILKEHPKTTQISIRVIIDESVVNQPKVIDYEFFKRELQIKSSNQKYIKGQ